MNKLVQCSVAIAALSPQSSLDTSVAQRFFDRLAEPVRNFVGMLPVFRNERTGAMTLSQPAVEAAPARAGIERYRQSKARDLPKPSPFRKIGR